MESLNSGIEGRSEKQSAEKKVWLLKLMENLSI